MTSRVISRPRTTAAERRKGCSLSTFLDLGVGPETADRLASLGITAPFPIQTLAIPLARQGSDVIGQARTGTGKTLAFGLPLLERITVPGRSPQALVVVPTRELAIQVAGDLARVSAPVGARILTVYGGRPYEPQVDALRAGVDVVVGTPGRLLDLARQRALDLSGVQALVLDEADEMLDLGFLPDVERILALLPVERQSMLFSATMPAAVVALARRYLRRPTHVRAEDPTESATVPTTAQHVFRTHALDKDEVLARVLQARAAGLIMVFCRTKRQCGRVADDLAARGFAAAAVHGDLGQAQREQALRAFRSGKVDVLVATDVAARGIDVTGVTHVVNYTCPDDDKMYLHRIGRTGRAGETGTAVTFVDWDDLGRWASINDALGLPFPEPAETYSTSAHLYETLDVPREVTGRLPVARRSRAGLAAEQLDTAGETGRTRTRRPSHGAAEPGRARVRRRRTHGGVPVQVVEQSQSEPAAPGGPSLETARRRRRARRRRGGGGTTAPEAASA